MIHSSDILKSPILIVDDQQANVLLLEQMLQIGRASCRERVCLSV